MSKGKTAQKSFLVEVAPLSKSAGSASLSYFSSLKVPPGSLVRVPLRKSFILGVALKSRDVKDVKQEIRRAGFLLKKIKKSDILEVNFPPETIEALEKTAAYFATTLGSLMHSLIPKMMAEDPETYLKTPPQRKRKVFELSPETILLQMEGEERFGQYRALVRQAFARGSSCLVVVPTHLEIEKVKRELSRGIEDFVYSFSLSSRKKDFAKLWQNACTNTHPVLIITTPACILFPRRDIDTIILERENSRAYRTLTRPYIQFKTLIENLCKSHEYQLVLGDSVLSLETLMREREGEDGNTSLTRISDLSLIRWRLQAAPTTLIDAKSAQNESGRFEIFSPELRDFIDKALSETGKIFLFGARKGLAPTTVCGDCGFVLPCLNCGAPVVLHKAGETTVYLCHACRSRRESTVVCGYCGSWKLVPLGIGTAEIARQAHTLFPGHKVMILDKDHAATDREAAKIAEKFREEGGILIGTELAFFHVGTSPYSAIVSTDALFSVPDFGIHERIFYLVSRARELTKIGTLVQTRNIGKQILGWASQGNIIDFYQAELGERRELLYPPFSVFIKVTCLNKAGLESLVRLKEEFARFGPDIFNHSLIMRLPREKWPEADIVRKLSLLGPEFSIKVDADSIL